MVPASVPKRPPAGGRPTETATEWTDRGLDFAGQKRYDEAIANYQKVLALDDKYAAAYDNWGEALSDQNKNDEAIVKLKKAIELDPTLADAYVNAANTYTKMKEPDNASLMMEKARALQSAGK